MQYMLQSRASVQRFIVTSQKISVFLMFAGLLLTAVQSCSLFSDSGSGYDILAESTDLEDVQAAVDSAQSGDVVQIPAGTSIWTTALSIPDDKKITVRGAGEDNTIIISNMPNPVIIMNRSGSRITHIGFELQNTDGTCISVRGIGWRVDHCGFTNTRSDGSTIEGVYAYGNSESDGHPVGVVDHNEFYNSRVVVLGSLHLLAHTIWHESSRLGTDNTVFIEDNEFTRTYGNVVDANYGGGYVFRYNTVNDAYIEAHSVQGNNRSARSWEIYNNTINQVDVSMWAPFFLRGGTGVVFNNTITGTWSSGPAIVVDNRRSFQALGDGGLCDGSSPWDGNEAIEEGTGTHTGGDNELILTDASKTWTSGNLVGLWVYNLTDSSKGQITANTVTTVTATLEDGQDNDWDTGDSYKITNGYPARDQIGRSTDQWLWTDTNPYPPQEYDPFYQWNNTYEGNDIVVYVHNNCGVHIRENRDYYDNQAKPGYTPYTYPHPLIEEWGGND